MDGVEKYFICLLEESWRSAESRMKKERAAEKHVKSALSHLDQEDGSLPATAGEPGKPGARP